MAENTLSPAFAVIGYHSAFGSHKMTIPTTEWFPTPLTGTIGSYVDHDGDPIDAEAMWNDLCDLLKVFMIAGNVFDDVTIYTMATSTSPQIPRASAALGIAGTSIAGGFSQAQSATFNFKTSGNGDFRLVLLDTPFGAGGFNAVHPAGFGADVLALEAFVCGRATAIQGRDNTIPNVLRKITYDLNDKLQRVYHMSR